MNNDKYEEVSSETHSLGIIVSLAEFNEAGVPTTVQPVAHEIIEDVGAGMAAGWVGFNAPRQATDTYRSIAKMLRDIADDCEKEADESEER